MEWLNYHHLLYFWLVAREGGLAPAGRILRLSHPTLSGQIRALEDSLGERLFDRSGRRLVLTARGRLVYRYADEIFGLGRELQDALRGRTTGRQRVAVGITDVVPKAIVHRLLAPAHTLPEPVRLVCVEDRYDRLLSALTLHEVDVVIADGPVPPGASVRAYSHLLFECPVTLLASKALAERLAPGAPASLDGAPFILPGEGASLRRSLEHWFGSVSVTPDLVAEVEDSALMKVLAQDGLGVIALPSVIAEDVQVRYGLVAILEVREVRERFYAITARRKLEHPAVAAIYRAGRAENPAAGRGAG